MAVLKLNNIKQRNLSAVLRCFCENDRLSRRDVAAMLGCDHATVTRSVRDLQAAGLLFPVGKSVIAHGRPREMMTLHPESPLMLGVELQPRSICAVVISLRGRIIDRCQTDFFPDGTLQGFCGAFRESVNTLAAKYRNISGCGIATFGTLDNDLGTIAECANLPELNGFDTMEFWQKNFSLPYPHITDRMPAEMHWFMAHEPALQQGLTIVVDAGEGIGMSAASNGVLLNSRRRHGGELGHNTVVPGGELCRCGRKGCLEAYASSGILLRQFPGRTLAETAETAEGRTMLERAAGFLALALANQFNNLMPDNAVITGELLDGGEVVSGRIRAVLEEQLFPAAANALNLVFRHGAADAAGGAALLAREEFFRQMENPEF